MHNLFDLQLFDLEMSCSPQEQGLVEFGLFVVEVEEQGLRSVLLDLQLELEEY
jgi:hypothetical protein